MMGLVMLLERHLFFQRRQLCDLMQVVGSILSEEPDGWVVAGSGAEAALAFAALYR